MGNSQSHSTYPSINEDINDGFHYSATFKDNYFADGTCRYAFKGVLHGNGPRNQNPCVTKVIKKEFARKFSDYIPDLAASKKAKGYADQFGYKYFPKIRNYIPEKEIDFLIPLIAQMKDLKHFKLLWFVPISRDEKYVKMYEHVALEPYIPGTYEKFNSNGGYEVGMHKLMTAFCHWTWNVSGHNYMICDLQGVNTGRKYMLTDPAIHSRDREFGPTDLGEYGMMQVLANHCCNELCRELGLNNPMTGVHINPGPRSTTYSFQVTEQEMMRAERARKNYFDFLPGIAE